MACYQPMIRVESLNEWKYSEKKKKFYNKAYIWSEGEYFKMTEREKLPDNATYIPCGKCIGCRLEYSRQWANRITLEAKKYKPEECWFLTLTYNDENLPLNSTKNEITGEIIQGATLKVKDLQDFLKRLRRHYEYHYNHKGIRFYAAGEYGELTQRPHYHICIFNMPIKTEMTELKKNELGQKIWTNEEIAKIWGKGHIAIARQSWETAAYTARYMLKKQKGENAEWYYKSRAIIPEFTIMSRKPGIAREYFDQNYEKIYKNDEIIIPRGQKALKIKPPKYYDQLYDIIDHEDMQDIKLNRRINAEKKEETMMRHTQKTKQEYREIQKRKTEENIKRKKREL